MFEIALLPPPSPQSLPVGRQGERGGVRGHKMLEENSQI
jgi:hypothetical protein